jgi:hypothetical protein
MQLPDAEAAGIALLPLGSRYFPDGDGFHLGIKIRRMGNYLFHFPGLSLEPKTACITMMHFSSSML